MKSAGKARNNGLYRHIRTSKEIIRNLLNDFSNYITPSSNARVRAREDEEENCQVNILNYKKI